MSKLPKIVVITGAESTGKSTLTEALAKHFKAPYIPEIAREYVENLHRHYNYKDVETIAKRQIEKFYKLKELNSSFIFIDTWLLITKVWFEEVYNKTPKWLIEEIEKNPVDLYLVCDTDLPWIEDPVRENGGERRIYLHNKYIENIKKLNVNYKIVSGKEDLRTQNAIQFLKFLE